jgi:hypothetical protein
MAIALIAVSSAAAGKTIYVDTSSTGVNDGTSWKNAYNFLQDALADANDSKKPVEIRVAQGIYKPDQGVNQTPGDRGATFKLINGVALRGGFAGLALPDSNARNVGLYETTLSGEIGGGRFSTIQDNCYHVLTAQNLDRTMAVDGFAIVGGNANEFGLHGGGGGLLNNGSDLTLVDCIFKENWARLGGGAYNRDGSLTFIRCMFITNRAFQWGGGVCNDGGQLEVINCIFDGNRAGRGGGIHDAEKLITLTNCALSGNSAGQAGAMYCDTAVYTNPKTYRVTRRFTIRNETAHLDRVKVWMPSMVDSDSQRNVVGSTDPPAHTVWRQPQYGSEIVYWDIHGKPRRGESLTFVEQFVYTCYEVRHYVDTEYIGAYEEDDPATVVYTRPSKYVETRDPTIIQTAGQIVGAETNPYSIAYSLYEWVIDHMTYRLVDGLKGATFALKNGYGECGDYSALFVALCRVADIPARPVIGRWATSSPGGWHVWAEFYLPGYGWIPVDPTMADSTRRPQDHFGRLDNRRLVLNKTFNVVLHPSPYFFSPDVGFLQTFFWEYHGSSGVVRADLDYSFELATEGKVRSVSGEQKMLPVVTNCIVYGNTPDQILGTAAVSYSDVEGGFTGEGNIDAAPLFSDTENGDYHLKSEAGRWDPNSQSWIEDAVTSPCIDAGDPNSGWAAELWPHGKRINMGAYGDTAQASASLSSIGNIADLNNDGSVDPRDMTILTNEWPRQDDLLRGDLDRNGWVGFIDFCILADNWLWQQE